MAAPSVVLGYGATGRSVTDALMRHGHEVVVVDDNPSEAAQAVAAEHSIDLRAGLDVQGWEVLLRDAEAFLPSPGVPDHHASLAAAEVTGVPVLSEFDLAARWDDRPVLAITGTDGKTTVTTMTVDMLLASGRSTVGVGNTETPLVDAIADPAWDLFVVEASSFRLGYSKQFSPLVGTWLNLGPDHLDKHRSFEAYELAKAAIWSHLPENGLAVANAESDAVMAHLPAHRRSETFGLHAGNHQVLDGSLTLDSEHLLHVDELWRALPHDQTNALAAAATARAGGATLDGIRQALREFRGLPHRVELVGTGDGIRWYNDSKATTPHAANSAISGFASVVLIAGGRNKGLDLSPLRDHLGRIAAVVVTGDAQDELSTVFDGHVPVVRADSMAQAVARAAELAASDANRPSVLLSPACTSFDWYPGYAARGADFTNLVHDLLGQLPATQKEEDNVG